MSILETFLYYGRLYGMNRREVYSRTEELIRLLELKSAGTVIDKLRYERLNFILTGLNIRYCIKPVTSPTKMTIKTWVVEIVRYT